MAKNGTVSTWWFLIGVALVAALAPWPLGPEPHVVQKLRWLAAGELNRPIDIFDLALHLAPAVLVIARAVATWSKKGDG